MRVCVDCGGGFARDHLNLGRCALGIGRGVEAGLGPATKLLEERHGDDVSEVKLGTSHPPGEEPTLLERAGSCRNWDVACQEQESATVCGRMTTPLGSARITDVRRTAYREKEEKVKKRVLEGKKEEEKERSRAKSRNLKSKAHSSKKSTKRRFQTKTRSRFTMWAITIENQSDCTLLDDTILYLALYYSDESLSTALPRS